MNKSGPVVVIEDDEDDRMMFEEAFKNLNFKNSIVFFKNGQEALDFLNSTEIIPFIILSDINMPLLNGFELRTKIHADGQLHLKCIPFLFFSTAANKLSVTEAYSMLVQGFFVKPNSFTELQKTIKNIMEYWNVCIAPHEFSN